MGSGSYSADSLEFMLKIKLFWHLKWQLLLLCRFSRVWLFVTLWTVACQAPLSMEFSRQDYWSRLPFPTPGDLPNPGIEHTSLASLHWQEDSLPLCHLG